MPITLINLVKENRPYIRGRQLPRTDGVAWPHRTNTQSAMNRKMTKRRNLGKSRQMTISIVRIYRVEGKGREMDDR